MSTTQALLNPAPNVAQTDSYQVGSTIDIYTLIAYCELVIICKLTVVLEWL